MRELRDGIRQKAYITTDTITFEVIKADFKVPKLIHNLLHHPTYKTQTPYEL